MSDPTHSAITTAAHGDVPQHTHPLVQMAMQSGTLDPATLRDLLALQREFEAGEAKKAYARAMIALKRELPTVIARDQTVDYQATRGRVRYTHASLAAVVETITGPLTAAGFSLSWIVRTEGDKVFVTARILHCQGHAEEMTLSAPADTSGSKSAAQAIASTVTLLERYSCMAALGLATADMKDPAPAEPDLTRVDANRNLRALAELQKRGLTASQIEAKIGRPVSAWTGEDLTKLREWLRDGLG